MLVKNQYQGETDRRAGHGALCYQIRQAFPHGEVTPEEANRIGYETAMRWTKGKYQFFVCTHIDKEHMEVTLVSSFNQTHLRNIKSSFEEKTGVDLTSRKPMRHPFRTVTVLAAVIGCCLTMTAFAISMFSSLSGDDLSLAATYEGNGVVFVQVENRSDKELDFQSTLKLMRWSTSEEVKPLSKKVSFNNTTIPAHSSGTMEIDLSGAYDMSLLETPILDDDWYYFVLTNNNFVFGQDWMCSVEFAEPIPTDKVDPTPITPVAADPELVAKIVKELRPYFESYTLDVNERNRLAGEYLEQCRKLLEQLDITIVPSVSPDELTLIDSDESVLFDRTVPMDPVTQVYLRDGSSTWCDYVTWNERFQVIHLRYNNREEYKVVRYEDIGSICVC